MWPRARAAGYTKTMSDKLAPGKDTAFLWGSSLKSELADNRLSIIGSYLEALLAEPLLRTNPLVTTFLAQAQVFADFCDPATISNVTTTAPGIFKATANADDAEEMESTAAAATTTTTAMTEHKHSSNTSACLAFSLPSTTPQTDQARSSKLRPASTRANPQGVAKHRGANRDSLSSHCAHAHCMAAQAGASRDRG